MLREFVFCLVICGACVDVVASKTIYVDNMAGDDRSRGVRTDNLVAFAGPMRTITRALRAVEPGDRIVLAKNDRPYRETVSLVGQRHSGSATDFTVLVGNGATLDGSRPVPPAAWQHYRAEVFRFLPARMGHQQLFMDGRPLLRVPMKSGAPEIPDLQPLQWCLAVGGIYFRTEPGRSPREYDLSYASLPTGITLYKVRDVVIGNLTVQGFQTDGLQCHDAHHVSLVGITSRGNGRSGIAVTASSRAQIEECLLGDNGSAQLHVEGYSRTRVVNCELLNNTAPSYLLLGGKLYLDGQQVLASGDAAP